MTTFPSSPFGTEITSENAEGKLDNNPYVFTPNANKLAAFNAQVKCLLKQSASQYYEYAQLYFSGKLGFDNWQSVAVQGIADFAMRLDNDNNLANLQAAWGQDVTTAAALASANGVLRKEVGKQLGIRHTPSLEFFLDAVPETARQIEDLLNRAREQDEAVAAQAVGATYAGEPDPYRTSDGEESDGESDGDETDGPGRP